MENMGKIINFNKFNKEFRKKTNFKLNAKIRIHISRKNDKYVMNWFSEDSDLTNSEIYLILQNIFCKISREVDTINYKKLDCYEIELTLYYYTNSRGDITYICFPQNLSKEKLAEYLYVSMLFYDLKGTGEI